MKICTVVGARPQFVKASVVSPALKQAGIEEYVVHTGQHYDHEMSQLFFNELGLDAPNVNLGIGSASHAVQTAEMMMAIAAELETAGDLDGVLVYGDTNSTLAAALVAAKLNRPLFHVEAGLRSRNMRMPEEQNRIITDRLASLLFCPTVASVANLESEGMTSGITLTGDVMYEGVRQVLGRVRSKPLSQIASSIPDDYILATVHRPSNVDNPSNLSSIIAALGETGMPVVFPVHPRTAGRISGLRLPDNILSLPPLGYGDMVRLISTAQWVVTDSGGMQKESFWLATPCVTLREETEWVETLEGGWNQLSGPDRSRILSALEKRPTGHPRVEDQGKASRLIAEALLRFMGSA